MVHRDAPDGRLGGRAPSGDTIWVGSRAPGRLHVEKHETVARILIVDDDVALLGALEKVLASGGHDVQAVGEARAALDLVRGWTPDLVLTDVYMPEMDGIEFLLALQEELPSVPIVVMSGGTWHATAGFALEDAQQLGALETLEKPFEMEELLSLVERILGG